MGYNSVLAIRYSDLDRIAESPEFASVLSRCALRANMSQAKAASSASIPGVSADWDIRISCCTHSSGLSAAVLGGEELIGGQLYAMEPAEPRRQEWLAAAELLACSGYEAKLAGRVVAAAADPAPAAFDLQARLAIEEDRMAAHRADPASSILAFTVLHDGFYTPEKDTGLGARMRETARRYDQLHDRYMDGARRGLLYSQGEMNLSLGNVGNGMSLIGLVPAGRHELVLMGGNYGRFLDAALPIGAFQNDARREAYERLRAGEIAEVIRGLNSAGISIKAPGRRRHSPLHVPHPAYALAAQEPSLDEGPAGP
ncbi:hypothetical protein [Paracoccus sp. ME4]|uniref:hypothetical protein n=1 Tax=Paracoccus sp. ME4 TaxID=3138066 RepID=UPI00398B7A54